MYAKMQRMLLFNKSSQNKVRRDRKDLRRQLGIDEGGLYAKELLLRLFQVRIDRCHVHSDPIYLEESTETFETSITYSMVKSCSLKAALNASTSAVSASMDCSQSRH